MVVTGETSTSKIALKTYTHRQVVGKYFKTKIDTYLPTYNLFAVNSVGTYLPK